MARLLMTEVILAALIAFGPAVDDLNRLVGLVAMAVTLALTLAVGFTDRRRIALIQILVVLTSMLATLVFALSRSELRGFFGSSFDPRVTSFVGIAGISVASNAAASAALPCAVTAVAFAVSRSQRPRSRVLWWAVALGPTLAVLTGSRDATLGLAVGFAAIIAMLLLPRPAVIATVAGMVLLATVAAPFVFGGDPSFTSRLTVWLVALSLASAYPLSWVPYGAFSHVDKLLTGVVSTHNTLLQVFVDFGPIGLAAVLAAVGNSFGELCFPKSNASPWARVTHRLAPAFVGVMTAVAITGGAESLIDVSTRIGGYQIVKGLVVPYGSTITFVMPPTFLILAAGLPPLRLRRLRSDRPTANS